MMTKKCKGCGKTKPVAAFHKHGSRRDGLQPRCKVCRKNRPSRSAYFEKYREENRERLNEAKKDSHLRRKYGITLERYVEMLADQDGGCAICGGLDEGRKLNVDHDHSCCSGIRTCGNCVRGLLCTPCNLAIGAMRDSANRLILAARYIRAYKKRETR